MKQNISNGYVLITVLSICLLCSLLVYHMVETSTLALRAQNNYAEKSVAFSAAETGITQIKTWLNTLVFEPVVEDDCGATFCVSLIQKDLSFSDKQLDWWQTHAIKLPPAYAVIKLLHHEPLPQQKLINDYYQVTIFAQASDQHANAMLQVVLRKQFILATDLSALPCQQVSWVELR